MHVVSDTVVKASFQVGMAAEGTIEVVEIAQTHLQQLLCNLFLAREGEGVVADAGVV